MKKNKMHVYLARRDKKGVKFLGSFSYPTKVYPTKIDDQDLSVLGMDQRTYSEIAASLRTNRMEYELFMETAESFEVLRSSLVGRGYSKIPPNQFFKSLDPGLINEKILVTNNSVMMRRGSSVRR